MAYFEEEVIATLGITIPCEEHLTDLSISVDFDEEKAKKVIEYGVPLSDFVSKVSSGSNGYTLISLLTFRALLYRLAEFESRELVEIWDIMH